MAHRPPQTYEEIVDRTVPAPDSSFPPTPEQRGEIHHPLYGTREDDALAARISEALDRDGEDEIAFEVEGGCVILRGPVSSIEMLNRIERAVEQVEGVESIDNRMHVEAAAAPS